MKKVMVEGDEASMPGRSMLAFYMFYLLLACRSAEVFPEEMVTRSVCAAAARVAHSLPGMSGACGSDSRLFEKRLAPLIG
jgi:hypothetical protein